MAYKLINEGFERTFNEDTTNFSKSTADELRAALIRTCDKLMSQRIVNIKQYEIAFQDTIEKMFPDQPWWKITDCDIFWHLFNGRDPYKTIGCIIDSLKLEAIQEEKATKKLREADNEDNDNKIIFDGYYELFADSPIDAVGEAISFYNSARKDGEPHINKKAVNYVGSVDMDYILVGLKNGTGYKIYSDRFLGYGADKLSEEEFISAKDRFAEYRDETISRFSSKKEDIERAKANVVEECKNCDKQLFVASKRKAEGKHCRSLKKSKSLTEKQWRYTLKNSKRLRDAIEQEDIPAVISALKLCYQELLDHEFIDADDFDRWTEELDFIDLDDPSEIDEDEVDFQLDNFYDLCDYKDVWIATDFDDWD